MGQKPSHKQESRHPESKNGEEKKQSFSLKDRMNGVSHAPFVLGNSDFDDSAKGRIRDGSSAGFFVDPAAKCLIKEVQIPDIGSTLKSDDGSMTYQDFVTEFLKYYDIADMREREKIDPNHIQESIPQCSEENVLSCRAKISDTRKTKVNKYILEEEPYPELVALYTTCHGIFQALNKQLRDRRNDEPTDYDKYAKNLIKALLYLPRHEQPRDKYLWRGQTFDGDSNDYKVGNLVAYKNFLSTSKQKDAVHTFLMTRDENSRPPQQLSCGGILFRLEASSGRDISTLSCLPNEEEVVFTPGTFFEVTKSEKKRVRDFVRKARVDGELLYVELKEVFYGFGKRVLLWVDDAPRNNKELINFMEQYGTRPICMKSTREALDWLEDRRNRDLLHRDLSTFRIITDMKRRENGKDDPHAGAKFIRKLRNNDYRHRVILFVNNVIESRKYLDAQNIPDVTVTNSADLTLDFGSFLCDLGDLEHPEIYATKKKWYQKG